MKPDQLTLRELLRDPVFRRWFRKSPQLYPSQLLASTEPKHRPWLLYVQRREDGPWQRAHVASYALAYGHVRALLPEVWDITIFSKRRSYAPPAKYQWPQSHHWCCYCRRPTVFWQYRSHHALRQFRGTDLSEDSRCSICGVRLHDSMVARWS